MLPSTILRRPVPNFLANALLNLQGFNIFFKTNFLLLNYSLNLYKQFIFIHLNSLQIFLSIPKFIFFILNFDFQEVLPWN